jgi:hypothetical protein
MDLILTLVSRVRKKPAK